MSASSLAAEYRRRAAQAREAGELESARQWDVRAVRLVRCARIENALQDLEVRRGLGARRAGGGSATLRVLEG